MKAKAVLCRAWNQPVSVEEVEVDAPRPDQVLVRVEAVGVCHSDLSALKGILPLPPPSVLGHEACGTVVAVGENVTECAVGDRVIPCWIPTCGACVFCTAGRSVLCDDFVKSFFGPKDGSRCVRDSQGRELNVFSGVGAMAEYTILHRDSVVVIDRDVPPEKAALVGCAVLTGVGAARTRARVRAGSACVVFGAGGVGLSVIQGCRLAGAARVVAVDLADDKLELARRLGATHSVNPTRDGDPAAAVKAHCGGLGADYAFEAVGSSETILQAYQSLRKGGTAVVIGVAKLDATVTLPIGTLWVEEKGLLGSVYGSGNPKRDIPELIALYRSGRLLLDELVSETYSIDDAPRAFADLERGRVGRGVIVMPGAAGG